MLPPTHPDLACIYNNIADVELHLGYEDAALDYIKKTLRVLQAHLQSKHPDIGRTYLNMRTIFMRMRNYDKTKECFNKTYEIYKALPEKDYNVGAFYANVSQLNCVMGKFPKALKHLEKARNIFQAVIIRRDATVLLTSTLNILVTTERFLDTLLLISSKGLIIFFIFC